MNKKGNPELKIKLKNKEVFYCPEQISAFILNKLKEVASNRAEASVTKAVITVPAYFNDSQRQATKDAGKLAGLEVLRLLNEPTAAAIAYALDKSAENRKNALIFDLGGGTFDVSIIQFENRYVAVKAIDGNSHLGGDDFDNRLLDYFVEVINERFDYDIKEQRRALARLRSACENAKQMLSFQALTQIELDALIDGEDFDAEISRAKFEDLNEDLFQRTLDTVRNCVDQSGLQPNEIDDIVLVGGSTRIPRIRELLQEFFDGKSLSNSINPDEAVALGAAIQAANLCSNECQIVEDFVLEDVVPLSLGVETAGGLMNVIIKRNTPLPAVATKCYTTAKDNQPSVNIKIFEGERPLTKENNLLGELKVTGILPAPAGVPRIDETFYVDENGILSVTATERSSGKSLNLDIDLDKGRLSAEEIRRILQEAQLTIEQDEKYWKIIEAKNELEAYCNRMLRLIRKINMTPSHYYDISNKCKEILLKIKNNKYEDEDYLLQKINNLKVECEAILELYENQEYEEVED